MSQKRTSPLDSLRLVSQLPPPYERRTVRTSARATQVLVGQVVGVSGRTIGRYEQGATPRDVRTLTRYLKVLADLRMIADEVTS